MGFRFVLVLIALATTSLAGQDERLIDLTDLPHPVGPVSGCVGGFSRSIRLGMTVRFVEFPDQEYTVGDAFTYEVQITNRSNESVMVPQSGDDSGLITDGCLSPLKGFVSVLVENGIDRERQLTGGAMYGDPTVPSSIFTLAPGESFRIRAKGLLSIPGVMMREYLPRSKGRVKIRAVYRLQAEGILASTEPSPPRPFTLLLRDNQKPKP